MSDFAQRCGVDNPLRREQIAQCADAIRNSGVELVRFAWCDQHGMLRGKTLVAGAAEAAMQSGIGMVGTLLLKDTSDRTAYKVFEPEGLGAMAGFAGAANLVLLADPQSYRLLPWAPGAGWVLCQPWFADATPVEIDTRRVLQRALAELGNAGYSMRCGLEVEFHIYRLLDGTNRSAGGPFDPERAAWPGEPPAVAMIHPGYQLLGERWADLADEPLRIVQQTAQGLGLPLVSLEIELGPSQVEAVFAPCDALLAADNMVLFRNGVIQALQRAGYHATFMCRPPFPNVQSSGWHLHQSLLQTSTGTNALARTRPAVGADASDALTVLSPAGAHYLAGLLAHSRGMAAICTPSINGYGRFRPHAMAPQAVLWGRDNRGAMLRVIGNPTGAGAAFAPDPATRIENRLGEPCANPYLYIAAQVIAGLDGMRQMRIPARASTRPYAEGHLLLPVSLGAALDALQADAALVRGFGAGFVDYLATIKRAEIARHEAAEDKLDWERREYFSRF